MKDNYIFILIDVYPLENSFVLLLLHDEFGKVSIFLILGGSGKKLWGGKNNLPA
jgi:hypothetical protein